ncbi:MAG: BamA/TamA family outer membrane protein [Gammaproteobacteria bacterium]|nr:BamA/TamA family outer membrane protein [Gammaproteobacteria bacterium]
MIVEIAAAKESVQISVTGVTGPALENILIKLNGQPIMQGDSTPSADEIQAFSTIAPGLIHKAMEPFGYFNANVQLASITKQDKKWHLTFTVKPGHAVHIQKINIVIAGPGQHNTAIEKYIRHFPLKKDDPFSTEAYEKARDALLDTINNQGYLDARFDQKEVLIDRKHYSAVITLHLTTGTRYYFGPVTFSENPLHQSFLNRFITFKEGEPFSNEKLLTLQQNLSSSQYFQQVLVSPQINKTNAYRVPIHIDVTLPKAKHYLFGFGYGTFTGPRATFGVDYKRVGHTGQHFSLRTQLSSTLSAVGGKYYIPGKNPLTDQYVFGVEIQKFTPPTGESFSESLSASRIKTYNDWQHTLSLNYLIERYKVGEDPTESSQSLYPSYTLSWLHADNLMNPTRAAMINFNIKGASEHFLSHNNFFQTDIKGKLIFSPTQMSRVIVRGNLGYTVVNDLTRLPFTMRYFAGGLDSVRGYNYSSIGPGRYLETASIEFQHQLIGDLSGAVFYDVGTATDHFNDELFRGAGVGLVYHSMLGPIKIYFERALSKPGKPFHMDFSIGPDL